MEIYQMKGILESALYLIEQIEKCDTEIKNLKASAQSTKDVERTRSKYMESLKKSIQQLSWED